MLTNFSSLNMIAKNKINRTAVDFVIVYLKETVALTKAHYSVINLNNNILMQLNALGCFTSSSRPRAKSYRKSEQSRT